MVTKYTLVRHSAYSFKGDIAFRLGVEQISCGERDAKRVAKAGGMLFDDYQSGCEAEQAENYPPDVRGLFPLVRGTFSRSKIDNQEIYIPRSK